MPCERKVVHAERMAVCSASMLSSGDEPRERRCGRARTSSVSMSASLSRTVSDRSQISSSTRSARSSVVSLSSGAPSSPRAMPTVSPSIRRRSERAWRSERPAALIFSAIFSENFKRRSLFATYDWLTPSWRASSLCVRWQSSIVLRIALASSNISILPSFILSAIFRVLPIRFLCLVFCFFHRARVAVCIIAQLARPILAENIESKLCENFTVRLPPNVK